MTKYTLVKKNSKMPLKYHVPKTKDATSIVKKKTSKQNMPLTYHIPKQKYP